MKKTQKIEFNLQNITVLIIGLMVLILIAMFIKHYYQIDNFKSRLNEKDQQINSLALRIINLESAAYDSETKMDEVAEKIDDVENISLSDLEDWINNVENDLIDIEGRLSDAETELDYSNSKLDDVETRLDDIEDELR